jgi:hypothetical protein
MKKRDNGTNEMNGTNGKFQARFRSSFVCFVISVCCAHLFHHRRAPQVHRGIQGLLPCGLPLCSSVSSVVKGCLRLKRGSNLSGDVMAYKLRVKTLTIETAGIPVVGPEALTRKVQIVAPASNAGAVYYGSKGLTAGIRRALAAGATDTHEAPANGELDLSALRFDAATNGDKITLIYYEFELQPDPAYLLPNQLSGLQGWWKADGITGYANQAPLDGWADASGNNKMLTGVTSYRPLYQTNVQNGLPGVFFDGVNDTLEVSLDHGVYTLVWAVKLTVGGLLWWGEGGSSESDYIASGDDPGIYVSRGGASRIERVYPADWLTGAHIVAVRVGATAGDFLARRDGASVKPASAGNSLDPGSNATSRNVFVGTRDGDYPIAGHLLEGMFFNEAKSLSEIEQLEAYLNDKWSLY